MDVWQVVVMGLFVMWCLTVTVCLIAAFKKLGRVFNLVEMEKYWREAADKVNRAIRTTQTHTAQACSSEARREQALDAATLFSPQSTNGNEVVEMATLFLKFLKEGGELEAKTRVE